MWPKILIVDNDEPARLLHGRKLEVEHREQRGWLEQLLLRHPSGRT